MDVNAVLLLLSVVEAGSLSAAARATGIPKSTISRRLRALEEDLGARLLQRTTRQLGLTQAGQRLVEHARSIESIVDDARAEIRARSSVPRGPLRVAMSVSFAERVLAPVLLAFLRAHDDVQLELVLDPAQNDLIEENIDVAIRIAPPDPNETLVARRLGTARSVLCASPRYLDARGRPEEARDLREHDGLVYRPGSRGAPWTLLDESGEVHRVTPRSRLATSSHLVIAKAASAGFGVAILPALYAVPEIEAGRLEELLPHLSPPEMWVVAAFPNRALGAAARSFVDFVADRFDPSEHA